LMLNRFSDAAITEEVPDFSIGPGLSFLADRTGTDQLVYVFGEKASATAAQIALAIAMSPITYLPLRNTLLGVAVIDLRTGNITWMNLVMDIEADVTVPGGANAYVLQAFGNYPKSQLGVFGKGDRIRAELYKDRSAGFTVMLPEGWRQLRWFGHQKTLARHSALLDSITIDRLRLESAFKSQGTRASPTMDPVETAKLAVNEMKTDEVYKGLEVDSIEAATVSGLPGFRADSHFTLKFNDEVSKRINQRLYGVATKDGLYLMKMEAVAPYYYETGVATFDEMIRSLKIGALKFPQPAKKKR